MVGRNRQNPVWGVLPLCALAAYGPREALADEPNHELSAVVAAAAPSQEESSLLRTSLASAVRAQGWLVELGDDELAAALGDCAFRGDSECASELTAPAAAENVLFVQAEPSPPEAAEPRVRLRGRLIERATGEIVGSGQRRCAGCLGDSERLGDLAGELAEDLVQTRASRLYPDTGVTVVAKPPDAVVSVGGVEVGPAGQSYHLSPGVHRVSVKREGFKSDETRVELTPDQELVLEIELETAPGARDAPGDPPGSGSALPWIGVGTGAASIALGAGLVYAHQDPVSGDERNPTARNSRPFGLGAIGVGALTAGISAYFLLRPTEGGAANSVSVSPSRGGGSVVWRGSF